MANHYINIDNKEKVTVTEVLEVESFDENCLLAVLKEGCVEILGEGLRVESLDTQIGELQIKGKILSINYMNKGPKTKKILNGLFWKKDND